MPVITNQRTGDQVFLDVVDTEATEFPGEVTRHPVEGFDYVSDHVINQPFTLELTCAITQQPFSEGGSPLRGEELGIRRVRRVVSSLKRWKEDGDLVSYAAARLGLYIDLAIENVSVTYGSNKDEFFDVVISLVEVRKGRSERVELPPIRPAGQKLPKECGPRSGEDLEGGGDDIREITLAARLEDGLNELGRLIRGGDENSAENLAKAVEARGRSGGGGAGSSYGPLPGQI